MVQIENIKEFLNNLPPEKAGLFWQGGLRALEQEVRTPEAGGPPPLPEPINLQALAQEPPPEVDFVINKILPRGAVGLLVGQTGTGKTYFALNLATWLACAFSESPFKTLRPRRVLYLNNEDSEPLLKKRLWLIAQHYQKIWPKISENLFVFPVHGQLGPLGEYGANGNPRPSQNFEILESLIKRFQPDLVILDTFSRFFGLRENCSDDVAIWLFWLEGLTQKYRISFLILHHPRKGSPGDNLEASRGSSVLISNTRVLLALERLSERSTQVVKVSVLKNNYADFYPAFEFQMKDGFLLPANKRPPSKQILEIIPEAFRKFVSDEVTARDLYKSKDFAEFREFIKDSVGISVRELRYLLPEALEEAVRLGVLSVREERRKSIKKLYKLNL